MMYALDYAAAHQPVLLSAQQRTFPGQYPL